MSITKNDLLVPIESDAGRIKECLGNVKTLELVLNVVSISGYEAGQKKVFLHELKCAGDRADCTIPSKKDWQLLGRFRFTDVFANRNGNGNSSLPRRL